MSWLTPTDVDHSLVEELDQDDDSVRLATLLAPALRIDVTLLRNMRMRYLPRSDAGLESALWFSDLVVSRSVRAISFPPGVARLLTDNLETAQQQSPTLPEVVMFIQHHAAYWPRETRLEQQLRLAARADNTSTVREGLRSVLRWFEEATDDNARQEILRWVRGAVPKLVRPEWELKEAHWLTQIAAAVLGDTTGDLATGNLNAREIPSWLNHHLPAADDGNKLGLNVRPGQLQFVEAGKGAHNLTVGPAIPALLGLQPGNSGETHWKRIWAGQILPIPRETRHLTLITLSGTSYTLQIEEESKPSQENAHAVADHDERTLYKTTPANLNIRSGPGSKYKVLPDGTLPAGTLVTVQDSDAEWRQITVLETDNHATNLTGWVHARYIERVEKNATLNPMTKVLSLHSELFCDHGGAVSLPLGEGPLTEKQLLVARITGCPISGPSIKPCTRVVSIESGKFPAADPDDERVFLRASVSGLTDGTPPGAVHFHVRKADLMQVADSEAFVDDEPPGVSTRDSTSAVDEMAIALDRKLVPVPGLYRCTGSDRFEQMPVTVEELSAGDSFLLLLPGSSNAEGTFADLWVQANNQRFMRTLKNEYGSNILAFNYWVLSRHPIANALDLVRRLPERASLTIIAHSMGGLIGELICRTHVKGQEAPFESEEIEWFQDRPEIQEMLVELSEQLQQKRLRVERFVAVGTPFRGNTLFQKSKQLLNLMPKLVNVVSLGSSFLASGEVKSLLQVLRNPADLQGLEATLPDSAFIHLINNPTVTVECDLSVISGDCEAEGVLKRLQQLAIDKFYGEENDLIVPTASMIGGANRSRPGRVAFFQGPEINHFSYFKNHAVMEAIAQALRNPEPTGIWSPLPAHRDDTSAR